MIDLENYTNNLIEQQSMYVEKVMMEFLEKQGHEIKEPYIKCVEEIQDLLQNAYVGGSNRVVYQMPKDK